MATLNFPSDPGAQTPVNTYGPDSTPLSTSNNITYVWDGEKWVASTQNSSDARYVNVTGDTMTGDLTVPNLISQGTVTGTNIPTNGSIVGYQQGQINPSSSEGVTFSSANGLWSRVGNSVSIQYYMLSSGAGDGNLFSLTLPYKSTADKGQNGSSVGSIMFQSINIGNDKVLSAYVAGDANSLRLYTQSQIGGAWEALTGSQINNNASFFIQLTYLTDDTTWTPANGATVS